MPEDLPAALAALRPLLLDVDQLVRAVAAGRRRPDPSSATRPRDRRAELRPVDLKPGRQLQIVTMEGAVQTTRNHGADAAHAVDALLAEPFGNWRIETLDRVVQLRVTKKGLAQVHTARTSRREVTTAHDRVKDRLLDPADPLFDALGAQADKRRQVDAFLRLLVPTLERAAARARNQERPLHVVDLGCGNAYLTFAAHRYLSGRAELVNGVITVGVDVRADLVARNTRLAADLGLTGLHFVTGTIEQAEPSFGPSPETVAQPEIDLALSLHACDTATDQALARAVRWGVPVVLAAPCCHHDIQRQLDAARAAGRGVPHPYAAITRHPILRERFADVLTDALRADLLRLRGYRVDVVEFVDSRHTPRNALLRAEFTGASGTAERRTEYLDLTAAWQVYPALAALLDDEVGTEPTEPSSVAVGRAG